MRVLLTLATAVFLSIGVSAATTDCTRDSLSHYLDHGACTIEDKLFDFTSFSRSSGPTTGMITISPLETPLDPGVRFEAPWAVDAREISVTQIGFDVVVNPFASITESIDDNSLVLGTLHVIAAGTVKVEETKCLGGFELDGSCEDADTIKLIADQGNPSARADFRPVHVIGVKLKITISGGDVETGGASLDDFSVRFSEVPEPATGLLWGPAVLVGLLARRLGAELLRLGL